MANILTYKEYISNKSKSSLGFCSELVCTYLPSWLLHHLFSNLAFPRWTHPSLFRHLSPSCSFPCPPISAVHFPRTAAAPLRLFISSSFQTGVRSTYCCFHVQLIRRWSPGTQPAQPACSPTIRQRGGTELSYTNALTELQCPGIYDTQMEIRIKSQVWMTVNCILWRLRGYFFLVLLFNIRKKICKHNKYEMH